MASRAVNMLQPLVLGWCSLAASGLLPKLGTARAALQQVGAIRGAHGRRAPRRPAAAPHRTPTRHVA